MDSNGMSLYFVFHYFYKKALSVTLRFGQTYIFK